MRDAATVLAWIIAIPIMLLVGVPIAAVILGLFTLAAVVAIVFGIPALAIRVALGWRALVVFEDRMTLQLEPPEGDKADA